MGFEPAILNGRDLLIATLQTVGIPWTGDQLDLPEIEPSFSSKQGEGRRVSKLSPSYAGRREISAA
jgi:hypothetical protein